MRRRWSSVVADYLKSDGRSLGLFVSRATLVSVEHKPLRLTQTHSDSINQSTHHSLARCVGGHARRNQAELSETRSRDSTTSKNQREARASVVQSSVRARHCPSCHASFIRRQLPTSDQLNSDHLITLQLLPHSYHQSSTQAGWPARDIPHPHPRIMISPHI